MVNVVKKISFKLFGWHWYRVKFEYRKKGSFLFSWTTTIGVKEKRAIDNHRLIKKDRYYFYGFCKKNNLVHLLCNGVISVEPICYLGRWK